jgi:hypothetical protein
VSPPVSRIITSLPVMQHRQPTMSSPTVQF